MRQLYRMHAMLFVCSYVGLLGYLAATDAQNPAAIWLSGSADAKRPPTLSSSSVPISAVAAPAAAAMERNVFNAGAAGAAHAEEAVRQEETRQARERLAQVRLQATGAEEPQDRGAAIDQLHGASPETLQALQVVIVSDTAPRNRIRAINSLRALAGEEGARDAVASILSLALTDANQSVASRANEVYREITRIDRSDE